jgi:phosphoglycerate dehydrogenase-like enzyme
LKNILVASPAPKDALKTLGASAKLHWLADMSPEQLEALLPSVDCLFVNFWPKELDSARMAKMTKLSFVQSGLAGVNHIPFGELSPGVTVSSNAGGYSDEVGEFAWALLLSGAKRIVRFGATVAENQSRSPLELGREVVVMRGRTLGVLGYGGIGRVVARIGVAFGMKVKVYSRKRIAEDGLESFDGALGLDQVLRTSDAVVLAVPLTNSTRKIIGREQLISMKKDAILVNVARAEVVDQRAIYDHLVRERDFIYATDVWWMKDGRECYPPEMPFLGLRNFIGTPHVAGPSAVASGGPLRNSIDNLMRYAKGEQVRNVVDRADYT